MVTATLYIEGGGEGKTLRARFRKGWRAFFDTAGVGGRTKIIRGAGRQQILEDVPKSTVLEALESATKECRKPYAKGKTSFELLGEVDPARVAAACPHAEALLQRLRALSA